MPDRFVRFAAAAMAVGLAVGVAASPTAPAADHTLSGKPYENKLVGFRFRPLNEWSVIPQGTDPNDPKLVGFYSDAAKFERRTRPECSVYAFKQRTEGTATLDTDGAAGGAGGGDDKPAKPSEEDAKAAFMDMMRFHSTREVFDNIRERFVSGTEEFLSKQDEKKRKKMEKDLELKDPVEKEFKDKDGTITIVECTVGFPLTNGEIIAGKIVAGWTHNDEYEVGAVYVVPGDTWKKYGPGVNASLRSFEFLTGEAVADARADLAEALNGKSGDARWLEEIKRRVAPGWDHLQTKNYLLVYHKEVKPDRVRLIARQIELIRKDVYEDLFPPDRPVTAISVVRVCKDKEQYSQYGGPGGSAGYWNYVDQELVFYEDTSAKADSLRVLNHEAFHQFIFYSVGSISPHDWFNEGHGDYFAGHDFDTSGKFVPKPFKWRTDLIKGAIGSKSYVPLRKFVEYSHRDYYGPQIGQNYAQGWSLIWFLRRQKNPEWKDILPNYFNTLKSEVSKWVDAQIEEKKKAGEYTEGWKPSMTPDDVEENARTLALKAAFGGFDDKKWEKFENEWKDFKYSK